MQSLAKRVHPSKTDARKVRSKSESETCTVSVQLSQSALKGLAAAAKASGQSRSAWIREALAEAISRRK
jgi:hypothetical protein